MNTGTRKKILLINKSFAVGGIQSSLVNMANELCNEYDVDLLIYNPEGVMKERLRKEINIVQPSWRLRALGMSLKEALSCPDLRIKLFRLFCVVWTKIADNRLPIRIAWKHQEKLTGYDMAIAYHHEARKKTVTAGFARVADHCVDARKKISWIHYDATALDLDSCFNVPYYQKMDKIVGVSRSVKDAFVKRHPELGGKADFCYNFIDYRTLLEKSNAAQETAYPSECFVCFSACRLTPEKALPRAIKALASCFRSNPDVRWYIAGEGPERVVIESAIEAEGLAEQIILIGNQSNPYPYMKQADLVFSVSEHEAAPMVYLEAKALHVPVFSTRTSSAEEILKDGTEDFLCENSEEGIRIAFEEIMADRTKVEAAKLALSNYDGSNRDSLSRLEKWLVE